MYQFPHHLEDAICYYDWESTAGERSNCEDGMLMKFNSGKGKPRRKVIPKHKSTGGDDKKLQTQLKKLNVQPIQAIEEVNMFKADGNVIHFAAPKGKDKYSHRHFGCVVKKMKLTRENSSRRSSIQHLCHLR